MDTSEVDLVNVGDLVTETVIVRMPGGENHALTLLDDAKDRTTLPERTEAIDEADLITLERGEVCCLLGFSLLLSNVGLKLLDFWLVLYLLVFKLLIIFGVTSTEL